MYHPDPNYRPAPFPERTRYEPTIGQLLLRAAIGLLSALLSVGMIYIVFQIAMSNDPRVPLWLVPAIGTALGGLIMLRMVIVIARGFRQAAQVERRYPNSPRPMSAGCAGCIGVVFALLVLLIPGLYLLGVSSIGR